MMQHIVLNEAFVTDTTPISEQEIYQKLQDVHLEVSKFIFGQDSAIDQALTALLAGGHMLLLGVPGLAKTRLVSTLSKTMGLDHKRIQCTPDLMPSDMIGTEVLEEVDYGRRNFRFIQGPLFCQFLLVDEVNRASPRTQSALLQAMQEDSVTMTGREHALPSPFHVMATQNPIEQEGTYPLPEAQLDRFLIQINMGYPDAAAERQIIKTTMVGKEVIPRAILFADDLIKIQSYVKAMPLADSLLDAIVKLVRNGRPETSSLDLVRHYVKWGPSPRASQALSLCLRAHALLHKRSEPTIEDLTTLIEPVLSHRIALNYTAQVDGVSMDDVIKAMTLSVSQS